MFVCFFVHNLNYGAGSLFLSFFLSHKKKGNLREKCKPCKINGELFDYDLRELQIHSVKFVFKQCPLLQVLLAHFQGQLWLHSWNSRK